MRYAVRNLATGESRGRFETEGEALARVAALLEQAGHALVEDLEVAIEDDDGAVVGATSGSDLLAWVGEVWADRPEEC